ncbi:MAG: hypothetical protein OEY34_03720, partial [Cyclobacteriaceae bacterium]|nr:hypothetical protein [Cyclobacteriaceae bacterium]
SPVTLKIKLTGGDLPFSNYIEVEYQLQGECPFDINTFVGNYSCVEPGYGTYGVVSTDYSATVPNSIVVDNFWDWGGTPYYTFDPNSDVVTLPKQTISMGGQDWIVEGSGTYDKCSGDFVVDYTVNQASTGDQWDSNTHTYTKQ